MQAGQEEKQKCLLQGTSWIFHEEWIERKKETWEMAYPIRRDATCTECVFETAVKPFHNGL